MSNPAVELIHQHGSVRNYKPDPVPEKMVRDVVSAGQRASTSSNLQTYSVVVTTDPEKRAKLKDITRGQRHVEVAPVFLVWCADFNRLKSVCQHQGYRIEAGYLENFMVASIDAAIAAQNAALAAESFGLGICYIGALRNRPQEVIDLFQLPELVYPLFGMTMGWPEESPMIRPRLALDAVLHWEEYQESEVSLLKEYDQAMIDTGIYKGRQVGSQDRDSAQYGWMEHSARRVRKPSRPYLRETVVNSGFIMK